VTFSDAPPKRWLDGHEDAAERSGTVARSGGLHETVIRRARTPAPRWARGSAPKAWRRGARAEGPAVAQASGGQGGNAPCKPRRIHDHRRGCMCSTGRLASAALNRSVLCFGTALAPLWYRFIGSVPRFAGEATGAFFGPGCPISLSPTPSVRCRANLGPLRGYPKRNPLPRAPSPGQCKAMPSVLRRGRFRKRNLKYVKLPRRAAATDICPA
jgi:hypothetical protein